MEIEIKIDGLSQVHDFPHFCFKIGSNTYLEHFLLSLTHVMVEKVLFLGPTFEMEKFYRFKRYEDP